MQSLQELDFNALSYPGMSLSLSFQNAPHMSFQNAPHMSFPNDPDLSFPNDLIGNLD